MLDAPGNAQAPQCLQDRVDRADKNWRFNAADLRERELGDDDQEAYRVMLERTSTEHAPWWMIPAARKWFRALVIE